MAVNRPFVTRIWRLRKVFYIPKRVRLVCWMSPHLNILSISLQKPWCPILPHLNILCTSSVKEYYSLLAENIWNGDEPYCPLDTFWVCSYLYFSDIFILSFIRIYQVRKAGVVFCQYFVIVTTQANTMNRTWRPTTVALTVLSSVINCSFTDGIANKELWQKTGAAK